MPKVKQSRVIQARPLTGLRRKWCVKMRMSRHDCDLHALLFDSGISTQETTYIPRLSHYVIMGQSRSIS